jgi:capsular polysaccharide biosynthesis protein
MITRRNLFKPQSIEYPYGNLFNAKLGGISYYANKVINLPNSSYIVSEDSFWVPYKKRLIALDKKQEVIFESLPLLHDKDHIIENTKIKSEITDSTLLINDYTVCAITGGGNNYFHFFVDILPVVFAALDYHKITGNPIAFIVPENPKKYQLDAFELMGINKHKVFRFNNQPFFKCKAIISRNDHRYHNEPHIPKHLISPIDVIKISSLLQYGNKEDGMLSPKKIIIDRSDAKSRRMINSIDLIKNCSDGYSRVTLEGMDLKSQISLFKNATHIIAMHGAGLTNLMHCNRANVLEIHAEGHGIVPGFFQISMIKNLNYFHHTQQSISPFNDIKVPLDIIEKFIEATK